jgi:hypothetical protein
MKNVFESVDRFHENYVNIYTSRFNGGSRCTVLIFEGDKYVYRNFCAENYELDCRAEILGRVYKLGNLYWAKFLY